MSGGIRVASRRRLKLRAAFSGPSKSGKTFDSLTIAHDILPILADAGQLAGNGKVCVIDTERGRSDQYSDIFPEYGVLELTHFSPESYIDALKQVSDADYSVTIVDQISHEWDGGGGMLERSARRQAESGGRVNSFTTWQQGTPEHNKFIDALITHPTHLIATMRAKVDYDMVDDGGRKKVVKLGLAPVQRNSTEYEFDIFGQIGINHYVEIEARGSLAPQFQGKSFAPAEIHEVAGMIGRWLTEGVSVFDPNKTSLAVPSDIQAALDLARKLGLTDSNLFKSLDHFGVKTFNDLKPADLSKLRKSLEKKAAEKSAVSV